MSYSYYLVCHSCNTAVELADSNDNVWLTRDLWTVFSAHAAHRVTLLGEYDVLYVLDCAIIDREQFSLLDEQPVTPPADA